MYSYLVIECSHFDCVRIIDNQHTLIVVVSNRLAGSVVVVEAVNINTENLVSKARTGKQPNKQNNKKQ